MTSAPVATKPVPETDENARLDALLHRIQELTTAQSDTVSMTDTVCDTVPDVKVPASSSPQPSIAADERFIARDVNPTPGSAAEFLKDWYPVEPEDLNAAGITESEIEAILLKCLSARAEATGRYLSEHLCLPFRLIDPLLAQMKLDRIVAHKGAAMMNDYVFQLTDLGRERAKKLAEHCTYYGSAPVSFQDYVKSVEKQTLANQHPSEEELNHAFEDLLIDKTMLRRLGPAINSGRGLFLFGAPGNGKTSIAERVTKAFGEHIWIPRSLGIDGEIMRLFDPGMHEEAPIDASGGMLDERTLDRRWVRIKRPTIIVGGELTMQQLEVTLNTSTNVSEAPIQMKSNCGILVIDDFGRQRMGVDELLNRWIVPLEKRYDFLNLPSGKKLEVPFDQLIIFSTNLEPRDLVDDAFLRRIPYKIEVCDPEESAFRKLFEIMAPIIGVEYHQEPLEYLVEKHYKAVNRPYRCCQPRDLLQQIRNYCHYINAEPVMTNEYFDYAVENYFAVM